MQNTHGRIKSNVKNYMDRLNAKKKLKKSIDLKT
jgi:hypothetical protein